MSDTVDRWATETITRKDPCPNCQGEMTMEINIEDGYGRGIYACRCGNQICQDQDAPDWVGAPQKICVATYCENKAGEKERLCTECIKQEEDDRWQ